MATALQELVQRPAPVAAAGGRPFFPRPGHGRAAGPPAAGKLRLLPGRRLRAWSSPPIFLGGLLLQTAASDRGAAQASPGAATFSAVLLEPQDLGLLAVQDDTLNLFERERP